MATAAVTISCFAYMLGRKEKEKAKVMCMVTEVVHSSSKAITNSVN